MIDACFTGTLIGTAAIFAVLPGFMQAAMLAYAALGQRVEMPRRDVLRPAWRWPVLPLEALTSVKDEEDFLHQAVARFESLARSRGVSDVGLAPRLRLVGSAVLAHNVGLGFRRPLMKALALLTLEAIESAGGR
jgi:hypothetical protein